MYILDTNVVSELRKIVAYRADQTVTQWFRQVHFEDLYISVITLMELEIGTLRIERYDAVQAARLRMWMDEYVIPKFSNRILPISMID